jgi:hypothetical protein
MKKLLLTVVLALSFQASLKAQDTTNYGTDFWVGYGHHQFMENGSNTQNMVLYLSTGSQAATVTVTIDSSGTISPSTWWTKTYNIPANTVITTEVLPKGSTNALQSGSNANYDARLYTDPPPIGNGGSGIFRKKGIHIQSTAPIAAYAHIYGSASSGASMLLPTEAWGYNYTCINSKQKYQSNCYSWAFIIAKDDSTVIEIVPSVVTRSQNTTGLAAGVAKTVTLYKGQIYQIIAANDSADANGNGGIAVSGKELTSTTIKSLSPGKQIAVFCGSSRTSNPATCGSGGGDNDIQQMFPHQSWGKRYLTAPTSSSSAPNSFMMNSYKIVVKDPTTVVMRNGVVLTSLINNGYYTFESNTADYITADKPIMVAQFMHGGGACLGTGGLGDPEMFYLSSIEQGVKEVRGYRNTRENITVNYITLTVPTNALASLQIIDNTAPTSPDHIYSHPNLPGYSVVVKRYTALQSQFSINCDSAFTGITYGLGSVESYGYNIGARFKDIGVFRTAWNGTTSGDWTNAANWSGGKVPDLDDEITVPLSTPFNLTIPAGATGACKKISLAEGAVLTVHGTLKVAGKK